MSLQKIELATTELEKVEEKVQTALSKRLGLSLDEFAKQFGKHGATAAWAGLGVTFMWFVGFLEKLGPMLQTLRKMLAMLMG